jgi:hypothetical protein
MFHQRLTQILLGICLALLLAVPAYAVEPFKVSNFGDAHQIWFEAEDYDERDPDTDEFFLIVDEDGAYGRAVTRAGDAGGMMSWTFDISRAGGSAGTWYFWGRLINPSNQSDYMLVKGDPDDAEIPTGPPYAGGDGSAPFVNDDDRIFEENTGPPFGWARESHGEGHTKELQDGVNTMYMFHRQGNNTRIMDVFMWTDSTDYVPTDADYESATPVSVEPAGKLATIWGHIKLAR